MLLVDNEIIEKPNGTTKFGKKYKKAIDGLKGRFGNKIVIDFPPEVITWVDLGKGRKKKEYPQGVDMRPRRFYEKGAENYEVIYYTSSSPDKKGDAIYRPKFLTVDGKKTIDLNKQASLAFYLVFVSPFCAPLMDSELRSLQNDRRAMRVHYTVFDENGVAEQEMAIESKVADVKALIASKTLGVTVDMLRQIAIAYSLLDPKEGQHLTDALVRKRIMEYVLQKNSAGKYDMKRIDQFIEDTNMPELISVRVFIKELEVDGRIGIESKGRKKEYSLYNKSGELIAPICPVNEYIENPESSLVEFLMDNPDELIKIKEAVGKK
jgi:hypothetical protein